MPKKCWKYGKGIFDKVLNPVVHPDTSILYKLDEQGILKRRMDISIEPPSEEGLERAGKQLKNGKAQGTDNITAELRKKPAGQVLSQDLEKYTRRYGNKRRYRMIG